MVCKRDCREWAQWNAGYFRHRCGAGGQEICIFNEPWRNSDVGDPWAIFGKSWKKDYLKLRSLPTLLLSFERLSSLPWNPSQLNISWPSEAKTILIEQRKSSWTQPYFKTFLEKTLRDWKTACFSLTKRLIYHFLGIAIKKYANAVWWHWSVS